MRTQEFPEKASRGDLEKLGARYFSTEDSKGKGEKTTTEYMIYENTGKLVIWKRKRTHSCIESLLTDGNYFELYLTAKITRRY